MESHDKEPLTTIYSVPAQADSGKESRPLLIFIPGNPGLIDFYTVYLDLLQKRFPACEILAISHAGFKTSGGDYTKPQKPFIFYDLEYQVYHKFRVIKQHVLTTGDEKTLDLFFLAHSVGSYITQRVCRLLLDDPELEGKITIKFVGLICPTIVDIGQSESGKFFTKLFAILPISFALLLLGLIRFLLPELVVHKIIDNFVISKPILNTKEAVQSWQNSKVAAFKIFQSEGIIQQTLTLAREEIRTIHKHEDVNDWFFRKLSSENKVKIWSFFALKDHWVHDSTRDFILTKYHDGDNKYLDFQLGNVGNESSHAITHTFCVDQSVEFSEITATALKSVMER